MYVASADNVIKEHQQMYSYVEGKMKTLRLGLKSYRYFDQAKALADKVGVVLNETMMNESSSLALSIYSPDNLASLLEDKVEPTKAEKIAIAKKLADKVGVVLNESMLNESSSLALSIYSPDNLASLLEDKEVLTRKQKIAIARQQMAQSIN